MATGPSTGTAPVAADDTRGELDRGAVVCAALRYARELESIV